MKQQILYYLKTKRFIKRRIKMEKVKTTRDMTEEERREFVKELVKRQLQKLLEKRIKEKVDKEDLERWSTKDNYYENPKKAE